jgi:hypothetical protein
VAEERPAPPAPEPPPEVTPPPAPVSRIAVRANQRCAVSIDGEPVGQTPIAPRAIAPGRHRVTCDPDRGAELSAFVTVEEGRTVEHVFRVRRPPTKQRIDIAREYQ